MTFAHLTIAEPTNTKSLWTAEAQTQKKVELLVRTATAYAKGLGKRIVVTIVYESGEVASKIVG